MYTRIVIATHNEGKVGEFRDLLRVAGIALVSAHEAGVREFPEETGATFAANALIKAQVIARQTRLPALADDSGIAVDALDGAPGVYSARFGEPGWTDCDRNRHLLETLRDVPPEARGARFVAALALVTPGGVVRTAEGVLEGRVAMRPHGQGGFGYDPLFVPEGGERTLAQMTAAEKGAISHRARAVALLRPQIVALMAAGWQE